MIERAKTMKVFVTGATGAQGGAVARTLRARGLEVCCLTRNTNSAAARELSRIGADVVQGDLADLSSLITLMRVDQFLPHERNRRRNPKSRTAGRYLKRIKYGNRISRLAAPAPEPTLPGWLFEVVFDYGEGHWEPVAAQPAGHELIRASASAESRTRDLARAHSPHVPAGAAPVGRPVTNIRAFQPVEQRGRALALPSVGENQMTMKQLSVMNGILLTIALAATGALSSCGYENAGADDIASSTSELSGELTAGQLESELYQRFEEWRTRPRAARDGQSDTLQEYAAKCDEAIGLHVPVFNCDVGTEVPGQGTIPNGTLCDKPNVLNRRCDPGSKFQVLAQNADAAVVAHCRKVGLPAAGSLYNDIAVIQYNKTNGAVCFYQALSNLPGQSVGAPSDGTWPNWISPAGTHAIGCTGCHDNGGLIRSPYLAQLKTGAHVLPSTAAGFDNQNTPLRYVGLDYADDRSWSVTAPAAPCPAGQSCVSCTACHRLAVNNVLRGSGTAADFALRATAQTQASKTAHSTSSPIWMRPGQVLFRAEAEASAINHANCANGFFDSGFVTAPAGCAVRPLGLPYLLAQTHVYSPGFGGDIFAQDHSYTTPDRCSPGYVRSGTPGAQWTSQLGGFCTFHHWVTPDDPHDCRAVIHAQTGGGWFGGTCKISVNEVAEPPNLAAFKPASQSSTPWGADAARAVDGNTDGNWQNSSVSHTDIDAHAWWQVDLGEVKNIGEVVLYNRTDCCSDRLADFDVWLHDGSQWRHAVNRQGVAPGRIALTINAPGRLVRVQLRGTNYLSLAEVQVFARQNLAAFKPAAQSSTPWGADAARAVDGNTNGNWQNSSVSHTDFDAQAWWQVDLGEVKNIGEVVLYNRTDCCSNRLADFNVWLYNGSQWRLAASYPGTAPDRVALSINAPGRLVRVQLRGTNYLSLAEVQVFAP